MSNNLCWICSQTATTAEHKVKSSDLKLMFRDATFSKGDRLIKTASNGEKTLVQGLNSKEVKYEKNLCLKCNSAESQPYDKAYEMLVSFIDKNHVTISKQGVINLKLVYGKDVKKHQVDLFKYFAKAFGCAIDATNNKVPDGILDVIKGRSYGKAFFIIMSINKDLLQRRLELKGLAGCSDLHCFREKESGKPAVWIWSQNLGWLVITYWHDLKVVDCVIPWNGKSKSIEFSKFNFQK